MAMRMICHGAASRCITSESANGRSCGVCSEGTLSASETEATQESPKTRIWVGSRMARPSSASRACSIEAIGNKSDKWRESENGEKAQAACDTVQEIADKLQEAVDALSELEGLEQQVEE